MPITDSQGSDVTFNDVTFLATKISITWGGGSAAGGGDQQIDVSHLGIPSGEDKQYQNPPLAEVSSAGGTGVLATITMDFLDLQKPATNVEYPIDLGPKLAVKGTAKCTEYTNDAAVNDVIRGSAKFDLLTSVPYV